MTGIEKIIYQIESDTQLVCDEIISDAKTKAISIIDEAKIEAAKLYQIAQDVNKITNEIDPQDITDKINALFD